jgi:hypothetical protein
MLSSVYITRTQFQDNFLQDSCGWQHYSNSHNIPMHHARRFVPEQQALGYFADDGFDRHHIVQFLCFEPVQVVRRGLDDKRMVQNHWGVATVKEATHN